MKWGGKEVHLLESSSKYAISCFDKEHIKRWNVLIGMESAVIQKLTQECKIRKRLSHCRGEAKKKKKKNEGGGRK